jgi:hypothetical protein
MKTLLFVNSKEEKCGVYQYGIRLGKIISKSKNILVKYIEVSNYKEFLTYDFSNIDFILFNYIDVGAGGPFDWLTYDTSSIFKNTHNIKLGTIKHTPHSSAYFDFIIDQDPSTTNGIPRPLYEFDEPAIIQNNFITIGSFGFQGERKGFDDIVHIVNQQYDNAIINLNITNNYYGDANAINRDFQINRLKTINLKPGIKLNITSDFLNNNQILNFLHKNDINLFLYKENYSLSSVIDYAITANKPIGITNDNSFKHIYTNKIDVNKNSINKIIEFCNNNSYVTNLKINWSNNKLIEIFEQIINKL